MLYFSSESVPTRQLGVQPIIDCFNYYITSCTSLKAFMFMFEQITFYNPSVYLLPRMRSTCGLSTWQSANLALHYLAAYYCASSLLPDLVHFHGTVPQLLDCSAFQQSGNPRRSWDCRKITFRNVHVYPPGYYETKLTTNFSFKIHCFIREF